MRISDWSSDVCSSDLATPGPVSSLHRRRCHRPASDGQRADACADRKSVVKGKSVSVRVDLGGRRIIKKNIHIHKTNSTSIPHTSRSKLLTKVQHLTLTKPTYSLYPADQFNISY